MNKLEKEIKQEIIDLHNFFVAWFTGKVDKSELENKLIPRFQNDTVFITTKGKSINYENLMQMFKGGYGMTGPDFRIAISDVEVLQEVGDHVLANYVEWQTGTQETGNSYNARKATVLISKKAPFKWLHIHETMLPKPDKVVEQWRD